MKDEASPGTCIYCSRAGEVVEVLVDGLELGVEPSGPWLRWVDDDSRGRAEAMQRTALASESAADWEIVMRSADATIDAHLAAALARDGFLLLAAPSRGDLLRLCELVRTEGTYAEELGALRDQLQEVVRRRDHVDSRILDDFSRMNNELVTMQRERVRLNAELERSNREKNRLLGTVAHDLRTPLTVVLGYARMLSEEHGDILPEEGRRVLTAIVRNAEYMSTLVTDVLDLSAVESGSMSMRMASVDAAELLRSVASDAALFASRKDMTVLADATGEGPMIEVDVRRIVQALTNLVDNAVKFGPPGSTVRLAVRRQDARVGLCVIDEGPGISEPSIEALFEPFRPGATGSAGERSTGLGLAIVRRIAEAHGGEILVESQLGKGSTFCLQLPAE